MPARAGTISKSARHLPEGLPALAFRLCHHEIGEAFHSREIELSIFKSPAGKLSRLRRTQAFDARERRQHRGNNCASAVQLKLGDIFAGLAMGRRKPQHQRLIDELAIVAADLCQRGLACIRDLAREGLERVTRASAAHAHNRDRRRRTTGRQRENGLTH